METAAALPLGMSIGTVMGRTRRGPFSRRVSQASRRVHTANAGTEGDTGTEGIDFFSRFGIGAGETCIFPCLAGCNEGKLSRGVEALSFDLGEAAGFEGLNGKLAGDVDRQVVFLNPGLINRGDTGNALVAFAQVVGTSPPMGVVAPRPVTSTFRDIVALSLGWFCGWFIRWCVDKNLWSPGRYGAQAHS